MISYVLASFPEPVLVRVSTKFADSEISLPQGAFLKSLPEASYIAMAGQFRVIFTNFNRFLSISINFWSIL